MGRELEYVGEDARASMAITAALAESAGSWVTSTEVHERTGIDGFEVRLILLDLLERGTVRIRRDEDEITWWMDAAADLGE